MGSPRRTPALDQRLDNLRAPSSTCRGPGGGLETLGATVIRQSGIAKLCS